MTTTTPRFPDITVQLSGTDGNAYSIIGRVRRALPADVRAEFVDEATAGDYDHVLQTCMAWVDVS